MNEFRDNAEAGIRDVTLCSGCNVRWDTECQRDSHKKIKNQNVKCRIAELQREDF
jgi:hypothetical protein